MSRKNYLYISIILVGALLLVSAAILLFSATNSAHPTSSASANMNESSVADMSTANVGEPAEFVGQITEIKGNTLVVEVLLGSADNVFDQRTGQFIDVVQNVAPEIIMGSTSDIAVGAIGQFRGIKSASNQMDLERIVILTGYIQGPSQ